LIAQVRFEETTQQSFSPVPTDKGTKIPKVGSQPSRFVCDADPVYRMGAGKSLFEVFEQAFHQSVTKVLNLTFLCFRPLDKWKFYVAASGFRLRYFH